MARKLSRREFISLVGATTTGAVLFAACTAPEDEFLVQSPTDIPEDLVKGRDNWFATTCGVCQSGDGLIVRVMEGRAKKIAGNPDFPTNLGKQVVHCESALQLLYHPDRVKAPMLRHAKGGAHSPVTWEEAEQTLKRWANDAGGRLTVATNPARGYDGWISRRFAEQFGGRYITFDPLEQGVLHNAIKTVFDQDRLPEFEIDKTRTLLSFGADFVGTWVSPTRYSVKYGQFRQGSDRTHRGVLIHVEPRMSLTAASADQWVPVRPGMEGELAMAIAHVLIREGLAPEPGIQAYSANIPDGALDVFDPATIAQRTGVPEEKIRSIARELAEHGPSLIIGGGSAGAHTNGSFNLAAIYALNTLIGSVGAEGGVKFNPGAPLEGVPDSATGDSFEDWERELAQWRAGNVDTLILRKANLVHGLPRSVNVPQALDNVSHVVAFADVMDDTTAHADLLLPESSFLEAWGLDIPEPAPGFQVLGLQQPVVSPARSKDGSQLLSDSRGYGDTLLKASEGALGSSSVQDLVSQAAEKIFSEGRSSSSVKAPTSSLFLRGLLQRGGWWDRGSTVRSDPPDVPAFVDMHATPEFAGGDETEEVFHLMPFPSQALLDGRVAAAPWAQATPDPFTSATWTTWVEINKGTAEALGIKQGDRLILRSEVGEIEVLAYPHRAVAPNVLGVPIGQGHAGNGRWAEGRGDNVLSILADKKDAHTGALAWSATRVRVFKTGKHEKLPKLEGEVEAVQIEEGVPILVVEPGGSAEAKEHEIEEHHRFFAGDE